jgi:hypothetical protein
LSPHKTSSVTNAEKPHSKNWHAKPLNGMALSFRATECRLNRLDPAATVLEKRLTNARNTLLPAHDVAQEKNEQNKTNVLLLVLAGVEAQPE